LAEDRQGKFPDKEQDSAENGDDKYKKSGTISFHVIVMQLKRSGSPLLNSSALSLPLPKAQVFP
jgi:hypothetical protein